MKINVVPIQLVFDSLHLDHSTGQIFWKVSNGNKVLLGSKAGTKTKRGYCRVVVNGVRMASHRVVWALHHGDWPPSDMEIDHINGDRSDNRPCNLRLCSPSQNRANSLSSRNTSGLRGVSWCKRTMKWDARTMKNKKNIHLGYFDSKEDAHIAYCAAVEQAHGEYAYIKNRDDTSGLGRCQNDR